MRGTCHCQGAPTPVRHRSDTGPTPAPTEPDTSDTGVNRHRPDTGPTLPDTARHPRHSDTPGLKVGAHMKARGGLWRAATTGKDLRWPER